MLVDFYTIWCRPCTKQDEILEKGRSMLKEKFPKLSLYKVNIDKSEYFTKYANKMGIQYIPQLILYNGGKPKFMKSGLRTIEDIEKFLNEHLK